MNIEFNLLESRLYDLRMSKGIHPTPSSNIVLVSIDDRTSKRLDDFLPLSLSAHVKLLETLKFAKPKAVGYLIDFNAVQQNNTDSYQSDSNLFLNAVRELEKQGSLFLVGTPYDVTGEVVPPYPLGALPHSIAIIHKDGNVFAEDKVTRRALTTIDDRPAFHLDLAQRLGLISTSEQPKGSFSVPEIDSQYFFFRYHGNSTLKSSSPSSLSSSTYPIYSYLDLLDGTVSLDELKDKIILVGTLSKDDSADFTFTPFSKKPYSNPKLLVHANILDSIIHHEGIIRAPNWVNWVITLLVIAFVMWSVLNTTPLYGVFSSISLVVFCLLIGQLLFQLRGIWIRESEPLVGIFLAYYLVVPYRLIREYKKRWDYQRKNELLTQVEELKTNFLQLVTHDLKTPVARIQGLAEVLLRKSPSESEKHTLHQIVFSTEELNRFISSILELSKVESRNIQLYFESKDINDLIEKAIQSFRTQAKTKKINIQSELEPLFPIRLDPSLMLKVISNLIDNAIKYSPENSTIVIRSQEIEEQIVVSISDQGIGLSDEEQANLFTRFYRAKNDATTSIPGTGLGLYLTKYFVECHTGEVSVDSAPGKGTTFKISLPLSQPDNNESHSGLTKELKKPTLNKESRYV